MLRGWQQVIDWLSMARTTLSEGGVHVHSNHNLDFLFLPSSRKKKKTHVIVKLKASICS